MICFSEEHDMYDVSQFISYYLHKQKKIISFSILDIFFAWRDSNKEFIQGANTIDSLSIFPGYTNDVILKYFKTKLNQYPFHIQDPMFTEPFSWIIEPAENHKRYISKSSESGIVGIALSLSNGTFIFLMNNYNLYNIKTGYDAEKIYFIERLNYNLFSHYLQFFEKIDAIRNKIIQFLFLTFDYAKKVDNNGFTNNSLVKYVLPDMHPDISNHIIIRYTANLESLIDDICNATDKSVENKYFLELLSPLLQKYLDFHELEEKIKQDFNSKKTYNTKMLLVNFYVSQQIYGEIELKTELLIAVRKRIAEICKTLGIKQGKFKHKQATEIVRLMQKTIFKEFEKELSKYEMFDLHIKALSFYSASAIEIFKSNRIYNPPEYLNDSQESEYKNIDYKTEQKIRRSDSRGLLTYLIETNLSLKRENTTIKCNQENFNYLSCFAHWLSELQNNADFCYHNEFDCFIEVTSDYRVNTENSLEYENFSEKYKQRLDHNAIYPIKNDEIDKNFIEDAKRAFFQDTDIEFEEMCNMIECLMLELPIEYTKNGYEIASNVFSVKRRKLISDIINLPDLNIDEVNIDKILNFLCISTDKIRQIEGENFEIIPVWEREKRDNRFQIKPILEIDDNIIFSPVTLYNLLNIWTAAFFEFYLPYEKNLTNLAEAISRWKKRYEKQIVVDIVDILKNKQFQYVEKEVELHSRDRASNHPSDLGDYDIIAVDSKNRNIYVIECKFLQKVGSIFKGSMEQKRFFFEKKYDEKFQKRIDYIKGNYIRFFKSQNLTVDSSYKIKPFMITNKVFDSFFKKIDFLILSFYEFKKLLNIQE